MSEVFTGALSGGASGAATGAQFGGGIGAIGGGLVGAGLGAISGLSAKKKRKKAEKRLRMALQKLLAGSVDAYGNTLSANKNGQWGFNLSDAGKNAKSVAESALLSAKNYQNKTPQQIADQNALTQALSEVNAKKAMQAALAKSSLRTGSNMVNTLSNIARQSTQNLRNNIINNRINANNPELYNANIRNTLNTTAQNAMQPLNSMQNNLQQMVRGLNMPTYQAFMGNAKAINAMNYPNNATSEADLSSLNTLLGNLLNGKKR